MTLLLTALGSLGLLLLGVALLYLATGSLYLARSPPRCAARCPPVRPSRCSAPRWHRRDRLQDLAGAVPPLDAGHLRRRAAAGRRLPGRGLQGGRAGRAGRAAGGRLPALAGSWAPLIGVLAVLTMTVGNLVALQQRVAVRLLAWSAVAQAGWVLLPLPDRRTRRRGAGGGLGVSRLPARLRVASLAAFAVVVLVARHHPDGEEHTLAAYRGPGPPEPVAAAVLASRWPAWPGSRPG